MIYDQIQSGKGIKDDHMVPLGLVKESCGPAIMMEPFLKQVNGHVVCCLYCGDGFYEANSDEVSRKLCAMVEKIKPDVVVCGPCFNYLGYGRMAARVAANRMYQKLGFGRKETNVYLKSKKPLPTLPVGEGLVSKSSERLKEA